MKKKYYVVIKGLKQGIYNTKSECFEQVKKYKGAIWKSFKNLDDANDYYKYGLENYFEDYNFKQKVINAIVKIRKCLTTCLFHIKIIRLMGLIRFIKLSKKTNLKRMFSCDFDLQLCVIQNKKNYFKVYDFNGEEKKNIKGKTLMGLFGLTEDDFEKRPNQ